MSLPSRCDVVVIGAGMGGLTSAALLANQGLDVCVIESARRPGGYLSGFRRRGFRFDTAIHWLNQCGPGGLVRRVFDRLGPDSPATAPLQRIRRYLGNDFDYLLTDEPDGMAAAMTADSPEDADGIRRFFDIAARLGRAFSTVTRNSRSQMLMTWREKGRMALPATLNGLSIMRYSRATGKALPRYFSNPRLRDVFCCEENLLSCLMPIGWAYERDYQLPPEGGSQAFPQWLCEQIERDGGRIVFGTRVERILTDGGKVAGVRVSKARGRGDGGHLEAQRSDDDRDRDRDEDGPADSPRAATPDDTHTIACRHVVAACDLHTVYKRMLPEGTVKARWLKRLAEADMYDSAVTLSLGLSCRPDELGIGSELITLTREDLPRAEHCGPDPSKVALNILAPSLRDPTLAPEGCGTLTIYAASRLDHADSWKTGPGLQRGDAYREYKQRYADVLLERVEEAMAPGLGRQIQLLDVATPVTHLRFTGNRGGTIMGARASGRNIRGRIARYDTPVRNLVLGGHWADYGGGVPVAVRAGANSALLVLRAEDPEAFEGLKGLLDG